MLTALGGRLLDLVYAFTMNQPTALKPHCSWCHKSQDDVVLLIASPTDFPRAYICDECVAICTSIIKDRVAAKEPEPSQTKPE
jgi:hypothetical protein